jgi:hypothetical protein
VSIFHTQQLFSCDSDCEGKQEKVTHPLHPHPLAIFDENGNSTCLFAIRRRVSGIGNMRGGQAELMSTYAVRLSFLSSLTRYCVHHQMLYADSPVDASLLGLYIHQNYPQFCTDVDECGGIADGLSCVDASGGEAVSTTSDYWLAN